MENILLQPIGDRAEEHYENTILKAVDLNIIKKYTNSSLYNDIKKIYPNGKVHIWGVTNGKNDVNKLKWEKMKPGDVTLFANNKRIVKSAVTTMTFTNKALAKKLWGINDENETWENIYLIDEIQNLDLTYEKFNNIVNYKSNYVIRGFSYLNEEKSQKVLEALGLQSDTYIDDVSYNDYSKEIEKLYDESNLDNEINGTSRKEQNFLRKILFQNKTEYKCGICGKEFPVDLMITAHIKKRADCSKKERLDVKNIVMPMCKFGCDDLYEKGYLLVRNGKIESNGEKRMTKYVEDYIDTIQGRTCKYWNEETKKYFNAHNKRFTTGEKPWVN